MVNTQLTEVIQKMIDNINRTSSIAGLLIKDQVKKDFDKAAKDSVDMYYEYKNGQYTRYGRQYNLYNIYKVKTGIKMTDGNIIISPTIEMDSSALVGVYHSNSSRHRGGGSWNSGGDVDADYVFENFIYGRHPSTNGWSPKWGDGYQLEYELIKDSISPNKYLLHYLESYNQKYFSNHVENIMQQMVKLYT